MEFYQTLYLHKFERSRAKNRSDIQFHKEVRFVEINVKNIS